MAVQCRAITQAEHMPHFSTTLPCSSQSNKLHQGWMAAKAAYWPLKGQQGKHLNFVFLKNGPHRKSPEIEPNGVRRILILLCGTPPTFWTRKISILGIFIFCIALAFHPLEFSSLHSHFRETPVDKLSDANPTLSANPRIKYDPSSCSGSHTLARTKIQLEFLRELGLSTVRVTCNLFEPWM